MRLDSDGIGQAGCFRSKKVLWRELSQVRWRLFPAGCSVVLRVPRHRAVVEFGVFPVAVRSEIIRCIHSSSLASAEEGWEWFERAFLTAPAGTVKNRLACRTVRIALVLLAALFILAWVLGLGIQYLAIGATNLLVAVYAFRKSGADPASDGG